MAALKKDPNEDESLPEASLDVEAGADAEAEFDTSLTDPWNNGLVGQWTRRGIPIDWSVPFDGLIVFLCAHGNYDNTQWKLRSTTNNFRLYTTLLAPFGECAFGSSPDVVRDVVNGEPCSSLITQKESLGLIKTIMGGILKGIVRIQKADDPDPDVKTYVDSDGTDAGLLNRFRDRGWAFDISKPDSDFILFFYVKDGVIIQKRLDLREVKSIPYGNYIEIMKLDLLRFIQTFCIENEIDTQILFLDQSCNRIGKRHTRESLSELKGLTLSGKPNPLSLGGSRKRKRTRTRRRKTKK